VTRIALLICSCTLAIGVSGCADDDGGPKPSGTTDDGGAGNTTDADEDGFSAADGDCDDTDPNISPTASDIVGDGIDQNCDGIDGTDIDGDAWASVASGGEDCDDTDAAVNPGATEEPYDGIDNDCADGDLTDVDGDGFDGGSDGDDCNDDDSSVNPTADELCDGLDTNCDGALARDEVDEDSDGHLACAECDDADATVFPGADEVCNDRDDDCDGDIDEDARWYPDTDRDGYGDADATVTLAPCDAPPDDMVDNADDCDDARADVHPMADEVCDHGDIDEDCDGRADDDDDAALGKLEMAPDDDGDGFGDEDRTELRCDAPTGWVTNIRDCDDTDDTIHRGIRDESSLCIIDADGDGWGDKFAGPPLDAGRDCDDADAGMYPGLAYEEPDLCTIDNDSDGWGDELATAPIEPGTDCDDSDGTVHPGASEAGLTYWEDLACDGGGGDVEDADLEIDGGHYSLAVGDIDGDGTVDLVLSDPWAADGANEGGRTDVFLHSTLSAAVPGTLSEDDADHSMYGSVAKDYAGLSVAVAGDVDGDTLPDLLIAAPVHDDEWSDMGLVYLVLGSTLAAAGNTPIDLDSADYFFYGEFGISYAGWSVGGAGDIDGDGLDDMVIGAPGSRRNAGVSTGASYIVLGSTLAASVSSSIDLEDIEVAVVGAAVGDALGESNTIAGDIDADGFDDLLVGSSEADTAYVVLGSTINATTAFPIDVSTSADYTLEGEQSGDEAGSTVSWAGDVDGDGLEDLLVGAFFADEAGSPVGKAYVVTSSTLSSASSSTFSLANADYVLMGEAAADGVGLFLSTAGDIDSDGLDDVLVGTSIDTTHVILGDTITAGIRSPATTARTDFSFQGGYFGSAAGDVNGDGRDDFYIIGSSTYLVLSGL